MNGWYWAVWAVLTVANAGIWLMSMHNLRETRALLEEEL